MDDGKLRALIDLQVEGGVDGIVPVGTTGESPTLDFDEHSRVIETAVEACRGRDQGHRRHRRQLHRRSPAAHPPRPGGGRGRHPAGDAVLQQARARKGSTATSRAVADVGLPVVLYNIPGRTGREIELETVVRLAAHPNVAAVKEAGGSVDRVSRLVQHCDLTILSGDDVLTLPMMAVGAHGVISVASNIVPGPVSEMVSAAGAGRWTEARALHEKYYALFNALLSLDSNPVPVKTAMALLGQVEERFRLPLCPMEDTAKETLRGVLRELGLLEEGR